MSSPDKLKRILLTPSRTGTKTSGRTDRGNTICPFHHSSNSGGIKINRMPSAANLLSTLQPKLKVKPSISANILYNAYYYSQQMACFWSVCMIETKRSAVSDLGPHCLLRSVCFNTSGIYGRAYEPRQVN